jgi:hypothetical protein
LNRQDAKAAKKINTKNKIEIINHGSETLHFLQPRGFLRFDSALAPIRASDALPMWRIGYFLRRFHCRDSVPVIVLLAALAAWRFDLGFF